MVVVFWCLSKCSGRSVDRLFGCKVVGSDLGRCSLKQKEKVQRRKVAGMRGFGAVELVWLEIRHSPLLSEVHVGWGSSDRLLLETIKRVFVRSLAGPFPSLALSLLARHEKAWRPLSALLHLTQIVRLLKSWN